MSKYSNFCYYYEYYDHYMGSMRREARIAISKLDAIADKIEADADDAYDMIDEFNTCAIGEVLRNWKQVRRKLETKGIWGDRWEEGSHAISMQSMADARSTVGQIEIQVFEECRSWLP